MDINQFNNYNTLYEGRLRDMSKSIEIKGIFKNNKYRLVGTHQPTNQDFTQEHIEHLALMLRTELKPLKDKFKGIEINFYNDGKLFNNGEYFIDDILDQDADGVAKEIVRLYKFYLIRL